MSSNFQVTQSSPLGLHRLTLNSTETGFPRNTSTRKLGEITIFYAVIQLHERDKFGIDDVV